MKTILGITLAALMATALSLAACDLGQQRAEVMCKGKPEAQAFECEVKHTKGSKALHVCWDVVIKCKEGGERKANACQDVESGKTVIKEVPFSAFQVEGCSPAGLEVKNLKLTVKK